MKWKFSEAFNIFTAITLSIIIVHCNQKMDEQSITTLNLKLNQSFGKLPMILVQYRCSTTVVPMIYNRDNLSSYNSLLSSLINSEHVLEMYSNGSLFSQILIIKNEIFILLSYFAVLGEFQAFQLRKFSDIFPTFLYFPGIIFCHFCSSQKLYVIFVPSQILDEII